MENCIHVYPNSNGMLNNFNKSNLKILLLGYGKSNKAVFNYFNNKENIYILNTLNKKEYFKFLKELPLFDICFRSPGIKINSPIYTLGYLLSKQFTNELVYALDKINCKKKIVITGSNGKTSLCMLLFKVLSYFNKTFLCGNIGETLIDKIELINKNDYLLVEASSFQLENLNTNIDIGIIKNLFPNHLNSTYNLSTYYASKKRIKLFSDYIIDDINSESIYINNNYLYVDNEKYININELENKEQTNIDNIIICLKVLKKLKLDYKKIKDIFIKNTNIMHRNNVYKYNDITFVDDGKSTSSSSSKYCVSLYKGERIIILGGIHKSDKFNLNLTDKDKVYIYGKDRYKILNEIKKGRTYLTLNEVLNNIKPKQKQIVIFSPGASSLDQYENYKKRSEEFLKWVNKWKK